MRVQYIGKFPPPYGGVTIKNALLFDVLSKYVDLCRREGSSSKVQLQNCLDLFRRDRKFIVGISAKGGKSALVTRLLYYGNPAAMRKSVYFMMGGIEARAIACSPKRIKQMCFYKKIYVETNEMAQQLRKIGMPNVATYPNCRIRPKKAYEAITNHTKPLRCVFFSLISPDKGSDIVLTAAKALPQIQFVFYGHIVPDYEKTFLKAVNMLENVAYHGVFTGAADAVYQKLSEHDVLLLPTKCRTEGVPGILVESKIAAVPAIVSDVAYNAEIVEHDVSGIVLQENTVEKLVETLETLDSDREYLFRLKQGAKSSAEEYYLETYLEEIIQQLKEE